MLKKTPEELLIDVSELEPPEPFNAVLQLLETMQQGQYIRMLHRKKPYPLLDLLQQHDYATNIRAGRLTQWEIFIWNKSDERVNDYFAMKSG